MAMELREAGIAGDKIEGQFLKPGEHDHVFDHPGGGFAADLLETESGPGNALL